MTVLVLTNEEDVTADYLIERAVSKKINVFRCNTEMLGRKFTYTAVIGTDGTEIDLKDNLARETSTSDISGIWYRRPLAPCTEGAEENLRRYVFGEYLALIRGLFPEHHHHWM